jgi:hypothetical protein
VTEEAASPSADLAFLLPPVWRPFLKLLTGIHRLLAAKRFIPNGVKTSGDGGLHLVERILDLIVLFFFLSESLVKVCWTML